MEDGQISDDGIPFEGKGFQTDNDAYNYYNAYAKKIGFGIRKDTFEKSKKASREILSRTFVCDKAGRKRASTENASGLTINRRPETKVGCGAKMKIRLISSKAWKVTKFISEHVHPLTSPDKVMHHHSHKQRHRSKHCISLIELLHEEGMKPSTIKKVLNVGYQGQDAEQVTTQQMIDHIRKTRQSNIGCECLNIIRHFQDRKESDPDFYFAMEVDHFGTLRSVFWADGRARASYLSLGDVVVSKPPPPIHPLRLCIACRRARGNLRVVVFAMAQVYAWDCTKSYHN
ncbi:protein FAR1-RELATED SEQUENCE 5-like [Asparagus officinalis]|uniref:protein FAR1-RELATED SEQUENCE 5-like n=1 Tax=Asparagus officinalis TaxID=4686 RepID=UPI00098DE1D9|nr:protein FAR1-RELATED SEQUENCE 5-like [Asparagus officinalis]